MHVVNSDKENIILGDSKYILTNKRLIIEDQTNSIFLTDIKKIELLNFYSIKIELADKEEIIRFTRGSGIDQVASIFFDTPFEAGSWQEETAAYTAYWTSVLTMTLVLYGNAIEYEELQPKKAWCNNCDKYVDVPGTNISIWKLSCPICGRKGMTSLSPSDRKNVD